MIDKGKLYTLIEEYFKGKSDYLVDLEVGINNNIVVEIDNDEGVAIDDCASLSRFLEENLNRNLEDFELTVTSSGLSSPLKIKRQYQKYIGKEVEVLTKAGIKHVGILKSFDEEGFTLIITLKVKPEGAKRKKEIMEDHYFLYNEIKYTKYHIRFK